MNRITEIRLKRGMTQKELADAVGVAQCTLSNWEAEKRTMGIDDALKLADALRCSLDDLFSVESI